MTKRERLNRATKNSKNPMLTWKQARLLGLAWCKAMWPDEFVK